MRLIEGKMADVVACGLFIAGLPLAGFALVLLNLAIGDAAGRPVNGDGLGLAIMTVLAYGLAALGLLIGAAYFGLKLARHDLLPKLWHRAVLGLSALEVAAPWVLYNMLV
jgi:hypothetical protein